MAVCFLLRHFDYTHWDAQLLLGIMPMPSIPPPVRREIDTPAFYHRRYLSGPTINNWRITRKLYIQYSGTSS